MSVVSSINKGALKVVPRSSAHQRRSRAVSVISEKAKVHDKVPELSTSAREPETISADDDVYTRGPVQTAAPLLEHPPRSDTTQEHSYLATQVSSDSTGSGELKDGVHDHVRSSSASRELQAGSQKLSIQSSSTLERIELPSASVLASSRSFDRSENETNVISSRSAHTEDVKVRTKRQRQPRASEDCIGPSRPGRHDINVLRMSDLCKDLPDGQKSSKHHEFQLLAADRKKRRSSRQNVNPEEVNCRQNHEEQPADRPDLQATSKVENDNDRTHGVMTDSRISG